MDLDDCDVLTGWDQPDKSPQRLASNQGHDTTASAPFSNYMAVTDHLVRSILMVVFKLCVESRLRCFAVTS